MSISPQGYTYKDDPTSNNPFWLGDDSTALTATAEVSNTTGVPAVEVTRQGNNLNFSFSNLKGEQGEAGTNGINGTNGVTPSITATASVTDTTGTPAVEVTKSGTDASPEFNFAFSGLKGETGASGTDGTSPTVTSTGNTGSGQVAGYISGNGGTITVYNGAQGTQGASGSDANTNNVLTSISITNENGVYGISQTKGDGTTSDVGSIEVPSLDNVLAEVTDSVVEDTTNGYDYHTIKETEHNGTQNDVGTFYIARKQITALNSDGSFSTVDQSGNMETGQISVSGGLESIHATYTKASSDSFTYAWNQSLAKPVVYNNVVYLPYIATIYARNSDALHDAMYTSYTYAGDTPPEKIKLTIPQSALTIDQVQFYDGTKNDIKSYISADVTIPSGNTVINFTRGQTSSGTYYYTADTSLITAKISLTGSPLLPDNMTSVQLRVEATVSGTTIEAGIFSMDMWFGSAITNVENITKDSIYASYWKIEETT